MAAADTASSCGRCSMPSSGTSPGLTETRIAFEGPRSIDRRRPAAWSDSLAAVPYSDRGDPPVLAQHAVHRHPAADDDGASGTVAQCGAQRDVLRQAPDVHAA